LVVVSPDVVVVDCLPQACPRFELVVVDELLPESTLRERMRLNPLQFSRGATLVVVVAVVVVPVAVVVPE